MRGESGEGREKGEGRERRDGREEGAQRGTRCVEVGADGDAVRGPAQPGERVAAADRERADRHLREREMEMRRETWR